VCRAFLPLFARAHGLTFWPKGITIENKKKRFVLGKIAALRMRNPRQS
jgi:hypothetical protein